METITESTATIIEPTPAPAATSTVQATAPMFRPVPPQAAMAPVRTPSANQPLGVSADRSLHASVRNATNKRILSVGPDIQLKGEIASCDRLVIEGVADAMVRDVHTVELAETGTLKGTAEVEDAEISGSFEGDLVVRGKLTVHSTGRVRGNVTYGEIEIQRGGQVSGNVRTVSDVKMQPVNQNVNLQKKAA